MQKIFYGIVIFGFFLSTNIVKSQEYNKSNYLPNNFESLEDYLETINGNYLDQIDGKYSSKIKKYFKKRDEKVAKAVKDSNYYFHPKVAKHVDDILSNIYSANPSIDHQHYSFFIKNSVLPNAACYGDGMFEVNLGLFTTLTSDDEIAFVFCHEIAHKLLDHSIKKITEHVTNLNSRDTRKKVRKLKRQKYGQTRAALSMIDELNVDILDYSREMEAQADSLGLILFSKTDYNLNAPVSSLEKIKREDGDMIFAHDVKIDSVFNFKTYPFKEFWLEEETSLFNTDEKIDEFEMASDTLSSHPEMEFRISQIESNLPSEDSSTTYNLKNHKEIKSIVELQSIQYTIDLNYLDLSIYQLITKYNKKKISEEYYLLKMAEVLQKIYIAKDNHELGKYVPTKNSFSDEKYLNEIRLFLHNLELSETAKLGKAFCEENLNDKDNIRLSTVSQFFENLN